MGEFEFSGDTGRERERQNGAARQWVERRIAAAWCGEGERIEHGLFEKMRWKDAGGVLSGTKDLGLGREVGQSSWVCLAV
ncbi:hypothetical protein M0R45_007501 [Rubus argutus]|uniref:MHC class I antigen n=1 Tax=Rubus argutus TaxID=59490 RepID=A0AAW1Y1U9_RUBAR